jgi:hypothetical protein
LIKPPEQEPMLNVRFFCSAIRRFGGLAKRRPGGGRLSLRLGADLQADDLVGVVVSCGASYHLPTVNRTAAKATQKVFDSVVPRHLTDTEERPDLKTVKAEIRESVVAPSRVAPKDQIASRLSIGQTFNTEGA